MNFLADESCAGPVVLALRAAGHDVLAIAEVAKGMADDDVVECALKAKRVLVTEDRDFGELLYARGQSAAGVVFVKFHSRARSMKPMAVAKLGARLEAGFVVVEPGRIRIARRPRSE
jgi:uncharacterized protein with PIN domain